VTGSHDQNRWICYILILTFFVFSIIWYAIAHDIHVIVSHLLYIPVILACYRFPYPGILFTLTIIGGYIGIEYYVPENNSIALETVFRGLIILLIGSVVSYLSLYVQKQEMRYMQFLSSIDTGVVVTDKAGTIQYVNPYASHIFDRKESAVVNTAIETYVQEPKEISDYFKSGSLDESCLPVKELLVNRPDGTQVPVMIAGYSEKKGDIILTMTDLSEEKCMAHELATGKMVLNTLLDGISEGVFLSDIGGSIITVNKACMELTGWIEGINISDRSGFFSEKSHVQLKKSLIRSVYDKLRITTRLESSDQIRIRHFEVTLTPVSDNQGKITRVAGVFHDITEHEKYLKQIREREEYQRSVLDGMPLATVVIDPLHMVRSVNQALSMLFEQDVLSLIGTKNHGNLLYPAGERPMLGDLLIEEDVDVLLETHYCGLYSSSPTVPGAYEVIDFYPHLGEGGKWIRSTGARLVDNHGNTIGAIETFEDFSSQKEAEEIVRISEERFKIASNIATDLIFEYEQVSDRISWFGDVEKWLGLDTSGRVSTLTGWFTLLHPDDVDRIKNSFIQHVLSGDPITEELRIKHRNGLYQTWVIKAVALYNAQFQQIKTIGIVSDISEIRANEEAKKKALVAIEKYIEQFAILGDHIRNPLQVIAGYNDLQGGEYQEKISKQINHVNRIVDQLDKGWIESESIRDFLRRHYGISDNEKF